MPDDFHEPEMPADDKSAPRRRRRSLLTKLSVAMLGFTALAALLFPSFRHSREPERRAQCESNLHAIGGAFGVSPDVGSREMFGEESDGWWPW